MQGVRLRRRLRDGGSFVMFAHVALMVFGFGVFGVALAVNRLERRARRERKRSQ